MGRQVLNFRETCLNLKPDSFNKGKWLQPVGVFSIFQLIRKWRVCGPGRQAKSYQYGRFAFISRRDLALIKNRKGFYPSVKKGKKFPCQLLLDSLSLFGLVIREYVSDLSFEVHSIHSKYLRKAENYAIDQKSFRAVFISIFGKCLNLRSVLPFYSNAAFSLNRQSEGLGSPSSLKQDLYWHTNLFVLYLPLQLEANSTEKHVQLPLFNAFACGKRLSEGRKP